MDFLDSIALPQSHEHLILLKYLLILTFTLFVPYLVVLIGTSLFSVFLKRKSIKENNSKYLKIVRDLVNIAAMNKSVVFALGIIPLISAIFCYVQLLQNSSSSVVVLLILSLITFVLGIILFFAYKNSINLKTIFDQLDRSKINFDENDTKETFENYRNEASAKFDKTDLWSLIFFLLTALFFVGAVENAANAEKWGSDYSILSTIFSLRTLSYFFFMIVLALSVTSITALFYYYKIRTEEKVDADYLKFVREFALSKGLIFTIILPLFVLLRILLTPSNALAYNIFMITLVLLLSILFIATFLYIMMKDSKANYVTILIVLTVILFVSSNAKDQAAFSTTSKELLAKIEADFVKYEEDFKANLGLTTVSINGEDIYNGRCIACHQYDRVLVGPAYKNVLPKYENNKEGLIQYILNPVKVDPQFPAMPSQGLKPNEAKAVVEYMLETYNQ